MRLLQLVTGPDELLDLHPNVTVVQGLDDASHRLLVSAVEGLARAHGVDAPGLLEAHGVLFDFQTELLQLLDLASQDLDPIVRPGDLPTQPLTVDARELREREQRFQELLARIAAQAEQQSQARSAVAAAAAAVEQARRARADAESGASRRIAEADELTRRLDQLAEQRRRIDEQLSDVRPARERAATEVLDVEARTQAVRDAAHAAAARLAALEEELAALASDLDPGAVSDLERAQQHLGLVMAEIEAERASDATTDSDATAVEEPAIDVVPRKARLDALESRIEELDRLLLAVYPVEADDVAEGLALLHGGDSMEQVPSAQALALADELDLLRYEVGEDAAEVSSASLSAARSRLDDARQALLEAEQAVRNPTLDRDDVLRLEDAHEELLDAIERADGRFATARARSRVEELRGVEQEILDRLGFASYAAFVMGSSLVHTDPAKEEALDAARAELAAAEDEWRRLARDTDAALQRAAVLDRRRGMLDEARGLLGATFPPDEVIDALRALRVPVVSAEDSARRLRAALERSGLELGDEELDAVELDVIAGAWLTEADAVSARRRTLLDERAAVADERDRLRAEIAEAELVEGDRAASQQAAHDLEADRADRLAAARAGLDEAEHRWLHHEVASERVEALTPQVDAARASAEETAAAASEAEALVAAAQEALLPLVTREQELDHELAQLSGAEAETAAALEALAAIPTDPVVLQADIDAAESRHRDATGNLEAQTRALQRLDAEGQAAAIEIERLQDIVASQGLGTATEADELEWYLLARLAAQRSVSVAGSVPLLLDDALRGLAADEVGHLLDRLERMGEAVQVIVVSDDPLVASWAAGAGPARAAVVRPNAP